MADKHTAALWTAGGALIAMGGIFMAVTGFESAGSPSVVWANSWFDLGFAFVILGALVVAAGVAVHFRREVQPGGAPPALSAAPEPPEPPPFGLRYYTRRSSLAGTPAASHFVAVTNPAGQPERRVHVTAEGMSPYPRRRQVSGADPAFPHPVPPEGADTPPPAGRAIASGQEQAWVTGNTWTRPDGKISVYGFFSDTGADWELGPDERWRISYRITCDGVPDMPFSIVIEARESEAVVRLEG